MSGIDDFISTATQQLGITPEVARTGAGSLFSLLERNAPAAEFGKVADAIPGVSELVGTHGAVPAGTGGGLGGALSGFASKASGLFGRGGGEALSALTSAGLTGDKATNFLSMFVDFLKNNVPTDVLKAVVGKAPALAGLVD